MFRDQGVDQFWRDAEVRRRQTGERRSQIDHPASGGEVQDTERAHHCEPAAAPRCDAGAIVHKDQARADGMRQGEGRAFSIAEGGQGERIKRRCRRYIEPGRTRRHPVADEIRRSGVTEFRLNDRWRKHGSKQAGKKLDDVGQHQIM